MATKQSTKQASRSKTTAIVKWDEELAKQAAMSAAMEESTATGQFFGLKGGILTFNDEPLPNNRMAVIILDSVLENVFYEGEYDPDSPSSPTCFAFGRDEKTMEPHKLVVEAGNAIHSHCAGCPNNEFGSAERGRGKACRNTRRVAMIPAGTIDDRGKFTAFTDPSAFESASVAYMKLPVTSVKGYAGYVKQVAAALKRPPFGLFTKVEVLPDPSSQFKVIFEALGTVPDKLMSVIMDRHNETTEIIEFPYQLDDPEADKPKRGGSKSNKGGKSQVKPNGRRAPQRGRY